MSYIVVLDWKDDWATWGSISDVIRETTDIQDVTIEMCKLVFEMLDDSDKGLAVSWGLSDSVFRDNVYAFISEMPDAQFDAMVSRLELCR